MEWSETYTVNQKPTISEIGGYVGNQLWEELCNFTEETYGVVPVIEYSKCSRARGFNVKYKKGSKAICTLYPNKGYFTCLLVIGSKEAIEAEILLSVCDPYIRELYKATDSFNGARWLMINVTSTTILNNVKELMIIKCKPKK